MIKPWSLGDFRRVRRRPSLAVAGLWLLVSGCSVLPDLATLPTRSAPTRSATAVNPSLPLALETYPLGSGVPPSQPTLIANEPLANFPTGTVISTGDGDTLRVELQGHAVTIRVACVDAPESNQPFGAEAGQRLRQLLPVGQAVAVRAVEQDRYGRTVAEVYRQGQSIGLQLVREGYAVVYSQYLAGCAATANDYRQAEGAARTAGLNFWSQPNPVMPWNFRRGGTSPTPSVAPVEPSTPGLPACTSSDCDCSDFTSQAAAQAVLEAFPGDPHRLDGDGNGLACERLP